MPPPWPSTPPTAAHRAAYADAHLGAFWLDDLPDRAAHRPLEGAVAADLCVIGGGFTGLWAALHAKTDTPVRDVVLLEAEHVGFGASGRNGGFLVASLTHGIANGLARFADELPTLERLGAENYAGLLADLERLDIACELEETGMLDVALADHELAQLPEEAALLARYDHDVAVLDEADVRLRVASPTYRGALLDRTGAALVHPGQLAEGLRAAAVRAGVRIYEASAATELRKDGAGVAVVTASGTVHAHRALLATGAYPALVPALERYVAPVYDYVLVTEPLSCAQRAAIGWAGREGIGDRANRFHYYRLTADDRILWGGYEAIYRRGGPVAPQYDEHDPTFATLSQHFFTTFPQLEGVRFTHRWGGAIDTCSRFSVFFGKALGGRVAYAAGYTGLGVAATRFGARVALDLLDDHETEATRLRYVRRRPVPFPPEPLRSVVIAITRNRLAAADRRQGRRGLWLGALDRLGLGFDS